MNFTLVELSRIKLEPGEVLSVKLYGDDYDDENVEGLKAHLQSLFPNNKVLMFVLPVNHDLQMEAISANVENKVNTELTDLVEKLNSSPCAEPASYCNDCSCGKKQRFES